MIKQITSGSDNWALAKSSNNKDLLLQVQKDGEQVRIVLPVDHAKHMIKLLDFYIKELQ